MTKQKQQEVQKNEIPDIQSPAIFDIFEMARALRTSIYTIRRRCIANEMPHLRMGRQYRFTRDQRIMYLQQNNSKHFPK